MPIFYQSTQLELDKIINRDIELKAFVPETIHPDSINKSWQNSLKTKGPLSGLTYGVKDLLHVDGMPTKSGTQLPNDVFKGPQASVVSRLNLSGATLIGKTRMDQFAFCPSPETCHPMDVTRRPDGSSSGSAAAVGANLVDFAIGTQTLQSIIRPAAYCGVIGYKPTYGRVATDGLIPLAQSFDTIGLLANDLKVIESVAMILMDNWTQKDCDVISVGQPTGSYIEVPWQSSIDGVAPFHTTVKVFESQHESLHLVNLDKHLDLMKIKENLIHLFQIEMLSNLQPLKNIYPNDFHEVTVDGMQRAKDVDPKSWPQIKLFQKEQKLKFETLMDHYQLDVLFTPAASRSAPKCGEVGGAGRNTQVWSFLGLPCITLPIGTFPDGFPAGLQLVGRWGEDEKLLSIAKKVLTSFQ